MEKKSFARWKIILTLAAIAVAFICLFAVPTFASDPFITQEPTDLSVDYPTGGSFTVEVADPEGVTYQWYYVDSQEQLFELDGTSATTNTLVMPSTEAGIDGHYVFCQITDKDGNVHQTEDAVIHIENYNQEVHELISVLYVEGYAIAPGGSIDLSDVNLGTGTISFNEAADKVTCNNVQFDNETVIMDHTISPAIGIMYRGRGTQPERITVELIGDNHFLNRFYQESTHGSGILLDFYALGKVDPAELFITGDGTLTLEGGTYLIRNNGKITVDADLTLLEYDDHFCDGIHAEGSVVDVEAYLEADPAGNLGAAYQNDATVTVCPGAKIKGDVNGTGIFSSSKIDIQEGSEIDISSSAPTVGAGTTEKNVFYSRFITINGAKVNIDMISDPDKFEPPHMVIGGFTAISVVKNGGIEINDSDVKIHITDGKGKDPLKMGYTYHNYGINCGVDAPLVVNNSNIDINVDCLDAIDSDSICVGSTADIKNSTIKIDSKASGLVHGLYCRDAINIENSTVDVKVDSFDIDEEEPGSAHGILSNTAINITLKDGQYVKAVTKKGIPIGVDYASKQEKAAGFDESYKPQYITIAKDCEIVLPKNAVLNRTSRPSGVRFIYTETLYNSTNKEAIEDTALIQVKQVPKTGDKPAMPWMIMAGMALIVLVIGIGVRRRSR